VDGISQLESQGSLLLRPGQDVLQLDFLAWRDETLKLGLIGLRGSFLAFRQLKQLVPEFKKFLTDNPVSVPSMNLTSEQGSASSGHVCLDDGRAYVILPHSAPQNKLRFF